MANSRRKEFQAILEAILGCPDGAESRVYFQPGPDPGAMQYPCIVYERDNASMKAADNKPNYAFTQRYQVTYIDKQPDSDDVLQELAALPYSAFSRHFATSGLNHDVYVIYH